MIFLRYLYNISPYTALIYIYLKIKAFSSAEGDVGGLSRRALLIEEEVDRSEERLAKAVTELAKHSQRADFAIKKRQQLENMNRFGIFTEMLCL